MPAMLPMIAASQLEIKAHGAVIATSPARQPLALIDGSGLPVFFHM
jgi:hypothetical protein